MISARERFIVLVDNDILKPSDAIILLEGDGTSRVSPSVHLLRAGLAPRIVISGGLDAPAQGCLHGRLLQEALLAAGVTKDEIILEDRSQHTRDQAMEVMELARIHSWTRVILVGSHYHQYRAYLTFLKGMQEANLHLEILNAPARELPWFTDPGWGCRLDLLESEFQKIDSYSALGHVATFQEAIEYQRWKECQPST